MLRMFLIVGFGSFIGGGARFLSQQYIAKQIPVPFPYGTLIVNIIGCFIIGVLYSLEHKANIISSETKLLLVTGFCGGFTTFSSFSLDCFGLLKDGQFLYVMAYVSLSVVLGFLATYLGILLIKIL
jgi:fluoride exporter